jgi:hypothetical protein
MLTELFRISEYVTKDLLDILGDFLNAISAGVTEDNFTEVTPLLPYIGIIVKQLSQENPIKVKEYFSFLNHYVQISDNTIDLAMDTMMI